MEGVALELLLGTAKTVVDSYMQHLEKQKELFDKARSQVEELKRDLKFLKDYVEHTVKNQDSSSSRNIITRDLLREVSKSVYRAEDAIDSFIIEVAAKNKLFSRKYKPKEELATHIISVADKVKELRQEVEKHINDPAHNLQNQQLGEYEGPPEEPKKYWPIFTEEEGRLRKRLGGAAERPDAILITGAHGIGKTTLAAKMFHDPDIRKQFTKHIWVGVTSNQTSKDIFLAVLSELGKLPLPDDGRIFKNEWKLSKLAADSLKGEALLLVLDNLWEIEDWKRLEVALRSSGDRSKVLITTNNDETARFIARGDHPLRLNQLSDEESWSALQLHVSSYLNECPPYLEDVGKMIAANCNGLPQVIEFAGAYLARKDLQRYEMRRRKKIWERLSLGMIRLSPSGQRTTSILSSYSKLPYHLRACFLYLGIFPERSKFPVSKLIHMWIAEGFVLPTDGLTPEETAEEYLNSLIDKNLVIIEEKKPDGSAKTCSMNVILYDFCTMESAQEKENFYQEFRINSEGEFVPPINKAENNRRVCVHSSVSKFIPEFFSSRYDGVEISLRSFVSHADDAVTLQSGDISKIRAAFKLLRVLDAKPMKFNKIYSDLCQLVHLRYVTLTLSGDVLPETISKLRNIQTLIVHTTSPALEVKADILRMNELRHFKTNASANLHRNSNASVQENKRLQTLAGISPENCSHEFFSKTPNLKNLGICGRLALLLQDKNIDVLRKVDKVEKLKLVNYVTSTKYESSLSSLLLQPSRFPESLTSLTLSATSLEWTHISLLSSLPKLEELKLKDNAFVGERWEVHAEGFPNLQVLHIERLNFKQWKSKSRHFQKLRRLTLSDCMQLREIPIELADVSNFQILHLPKGCHPSAAECADTINAIKEEKNRADNSIAFTLSFHDH